MKTKINLYLTKLLDNNFKILSKLYKLFRITKNLTLLLLYAFIFIQLSTNLKAQEKEVVPEFENIYQVNKDKAHDGFLFRYILGPVNGQNIYINNNKPRDEYSWTGLLMGFEFGGAPRNYVAFHSGLTLLYAPLLPKKTLSEGLDALGPYNSTDILKVNNAFYTEVGLNVGVSFYIMPAMVYFKPEFNLFSTGLTSIDTTLSKKTTTSNQNQNANVSKISNKTEVAENNSTDVFWYNSSFLGGYGLTIGKEWWAKKDLGVGFAISYKYNRFRRAIEDVVYTMENNYYGLQLSVTYN